MNNINEDFEVREAKGILGEICETYYDEEIMIADGLDEAVIGIDEQSMRLIYSVKKCVDIIMRDNKLNDLDATEYFEVNVSNSYVGDKTPIWCEDRFISLL